MERISCIDTVGLQGALGSRVSCSFDHPSGLCEWNSDPEAPFHWRVGQGRSEDRVSGPRNDHTCQNKRGHYLYIAGKDADKGADATVWSPAVSLNQSQWFTFWYTMNGYGTGNLSLLRLENNSSVVLWFKAGHQSFSWLSANVTLDPGMFSLQFKATVRIPIASNLAIDDLHLLSEESQSLGRSYCMLPVSTTPTTVTTTRTTVTITSSATITTAVSLSTFPPICGSNESDLVELPVICDFEHSTCDLVVVANDTDPKVTWTRTNHPHGTLSMIPGDHTHEIKSKERKYDNSLISVDF
ncbi:MAM and LDL-receptor class A domain-containing protein 1-like [Mya arenaria]|uniref:MAM and LDL-receptor class A domain-containing protein 1-like n=1 Tax=Mya arenaria TaxID=6604 RepID=UPI0022E5F6B2|nr:MAM and LDL-receptor class A domain-containing protein 1-like [Mya arenaria]